MPNHITNIIKMEGEEEEIKKCLNKIKGKSKDMEGTIIDFQNIIPMPEDIIRRDLGYEEQKKSNGRNWYDWSISNWGTKWNAYDQNMLDDNKFRFDTAWSCPLPVLKELSKGFSELIFSISYADEDIGANCGHFVLDRGEMIGEYIPKKGKKADAFALAVKDGDTIEESSSLKIEIRKALKRKEVK